MSPSIISYYFKILYPNIASHIVASIPTANVHHILTSENLSAATIVKIVPATKVVKLAFAKLTIALYRYHA